MEETSSGLKSNCKELVSLCLSTKSVPSASSAKLVVSNEDLLAEILLHVPVRSLICLKLVSKQWLSLITSHRFVLLHYGRGTSSRTSALFLESEVLLRRGANNHMMYVHLNLDKFHKTPFRSSTFSHDPFDAKKVCILQSCHGLLLCRTGIVVNQLLENQRGLFYYYIYNPTTNQVATIDRIWDQKTTIHASVLDFDPARSPHYRVVFCVNKSPEMAPQQRQFEVYFSETRTWKVSAQHAHFVPPFGLTMSNLAYYKGSIYWVSSSKSVNIVLSYNVDEETLATLPKPPQRDSRFIRKNLYFGESAGHLHLAEVFPCAASSLDVYELNPDHSDWFLKFKVDLDQLSKDFPEMTHNKHTFVNEYAFSILSLVRRREFDGDSFVVLEVPGKVIVYSLVDQSWYEVCNFRQADNARDWICGIFRAMDYNESLACVTTASFC